MPPPSINHKLVVVIGVTRVTRTQNVTVMLLASVYNQGVCSGIIVVDAVPILPPIKTEIKLETHVVMTMIN